MDCTKKSVNRKLKEGVRNRGEWESQAVDIHTHKIRNKEILKRMMNIMKEKEKKV